ncbi:MAG: hypothetical protein D6761_01985 [Candidatus Dadabacteria bacterium]|nr:MAG: hypothetical protein D6761_01985 [Candidatus Dadabacteria bacterium]
MILAGVSGCFGGEGALDTETCPTNELVCAGKAALAKGDFDTAITRFKQLLTDVDAGEAAADLACAADYGLLLGRILEGVDKLDSLLETADLFLGGAPSFATLRGRVEGLQPAQFGDLNSLVEGFIRPFEESAADVREQALAVIDGDCVFELREGLPINIGAENSLLFFSATLGYEWDTAVARTILALVDAFQVAVDLILAHDLSFDDLEGPLEVILDDIDLLVKGDITYIELLRDAGVLLDRNPDLLDFTLESDVRLDEVDNLLLEQYRAIYDDTGDTVHGIIPDMLIRSRTDDDPSDNVLGWIDPDNNGADGDDILVVGLRQVNLFSTIALTDNTGGVQVIFNSQFGDIRTVIESLHTIIDVLGNQVEAVDDTSIPYPQGEYRPLGFEEINTIINSVDLLKLFLPTLPEAVEFDFRSYFVGPTGTEGPLPIRKLFPYWYDDDNCTVNRVPKDITDFCKADVFMIEGEAAVSSPAVVTMDAPHFTTSFTFGPRGETGEFVSGLTIPADGISAADLGLEVPFPYIAWQSPSFHGMILVNEMALPVNPATMVTVPLDYKGEPFVQADQFLINKAVNAYIAYLLDRENPFASLINSQ